MATDSGVLVCEALRSRSEQLANKYPEAVAALTVWPFGQSRSYID